MPNIVRGYLEAHNLKIRSCMPLFLDLDYGPILKLCKSPSIPLHTHARIISLTFDGPHGDIP